MDGTREGTAIPPTPRQVGVLFLTRPQWEQGLVRLREVQFALYLRPDQTLPSPQDRGKGPEKQTMLCKEYILAIILTYKC